MYNNGRIQNKYDYKSYHYGEDMIEKTIKKRAKRSIIWKMPTEDLITLVKQSDRLGDILKVFGLENKGGNHRTLKRRLDEENIDYSHIKLGLDANKGRKFDIKPLELEELFRENSPHSRSTVKKYILKNHLIPYKCSICGNEGQWNNNNLVLILDHINGINNDHRLENLRFLCPNCNSQQETFAGKNRVHKKSNYCIDCHTEILTQSKRCSKCNEKYLSSLSSKPSKKQLSEDIIELNNVKIGEKYGVSESSVRKWLKKYGLKR